MNAIKFFAVSIVCVAMSVGFISCGSEYDPTQDEKNILLDLPTFVKEVEGLSLEDISSKLQNRGYVFAGSQGGELFYVINANAFHVDSIPYSTVMSEDFFKYVGSKSSILSLYVENNKITEAYIIYFLPQDGATIKYSAIHKNARAYSQTNYPFVFSMEEQELVTFSEWEAGAMINDDMLMYTNYYDLYQAMYDNGLMTKSVLDRAITSLRQSGYGTYQEFLASILEIQYLEEYTINYNESEELALDYSFVSSELVDEVGLDGIPAGLSVAIGLLFQDYESDWHAPMAAPMKEKSSKSLLKLQSIFK